MQGKEAKAQYEHADKLFREGYYEESLSVLQELNALYPNQKNVLFAAAKCLEKIGSIEESKSLCRQIIRDFDDKKAHDLLHRLESGPNVAIVVEDSTVALGPEWQALNSVQVQAPKSPVPYVSLGRSSPEIQWKTLFLIVATGLLQLNIMVFSWSPLLLLVGIPGWVLQTYLYKRIIKNSGAKTSFLIWVPVVQIYDIVSGVGMDSAFWRKLLVQLFVSCICIFFISALTFPVWWDVFLLLNYFAMLVFTASIVAFIVVFHIRLCACCGKSPWLCLFMLVPGGYPFVISYLAFSEPGVNNKGFGNFMGYMLENPNTKKYIIVAAVLLFTLFLILPLVLHSCRTG